MKISIIGGSGFIGTRLAKRLLQSGHEVKIADKKESITYPYLRVFADVSVPESLEKVLPGSDIVINLAAEHRDDVTPRSLYDEVNVKGAENVCNACLKLGIKKIIFTSSVAVYGFAPIGTDETGKINYFNDYGRTKWLAEEKYRAWLKNDPENSLTIIRPTVVFGEQNRGNVYNLLRQIAEGRFLMVGKGTNKKSMAYVENVAAFIEYCLNNQPGEHLFNYVDKPDFDMNQLVSEVNQMLGRKKNMIHWPYWMGYAGGLGFDILAKITGRKYAISSIRVKKFCANTMFESSNIKKTGFIPPVSIIDGLRNTINYEFINKIKDYEFYTE
ncbi:NAD-dependent epimerase/dehydratase family protein [Rectinema subterraneum]|jgi:nucleoside-diphosphate-sugar epimerase|uniref:NAD-dependent epimerase/dehydratase family protein n=1 Tax=Rectinema subterraneum TaxID=2653714 RepID=UPI00131B205B|nr:NAD-dependent epimerase/dehydratase family protein [Rectinema subterraneum]